MLSIRSRWLLVAACALLVVAEGCRPERGKRRRGGPNGTNSTSPNSTSPNSTTPPMKMDDVPPMGGSSEDKREDKRDVKPGITKKVWGQTKDGKDVHLFTIVNKKGMLVELSSFGAAVVKVEVADRDGKFDNVTLGFDKFEPYLGDHPYFGVTVGRYANRIAQGKFKLNDKEYQLPTNAGEHHLHGGPGGFHHVLWNAEKIEIEEVKDEESGEVQQPGERGVKFTYTSPDGEESYPGKLEVSATYTLTDSNELKMVFRAKLAEDEKVDTIVNLVNHAYWNLAGADSGSVLDHVLQIFADKYVKVDKDLIPTGELTDVSGTPLDLRKPTRLSVRINDPMLKEVPGEGFDHCYVLNSQSGDLAHAATLVDQPTGRVMEVWTTQPGIQFYSGNHLAGEESQAGAPKHGAVCLETQHYPDSPNHANFPPVVLKPGKLYKQTTVHKFYVKE